MSANIITVSDATFDEQVKSSDVPVLVDFWAEWCGPCRVVEPILEEIANENPTGIVIAKLNVDENPTIQRRFEVMSIPTMILFKNGSAEARIVGAKSKAALLQDIQPHLS